MGVCEWSYLVFFNDTATTEIYTRSLHDALPIWEGGSKKVRGETESEGGDRERGGESREGETDWLRKIPNAVW